MPIPQNKVELIEAIQSTYFKLRKDLEEIPQGLTQAKEMDGHAKGTKMSVDNLVAYLIGWGELVLKWHLKKTKGEEINFPEKGFQWNELGGLAQKFYKDYEHKDYHSLLKKLDNTVKEILKLVDEKESNELYEIPWYGKYPMGRMIQLNTSSPYKNARSRVRKWKKSKL